MKNYLYLAAIFAGLLFINACQSNGDDSSTTQKAVASNVAASRSTPSVEVIHPSSRSFNSDIVITGSVKADKSVTLHAMEQGFLKSISVDIGDKVTKGQAIAQLSNPMLSFEMKSAEVKVKEAEAKLKGAQAELKVAEADASIKQNMWTRLKSVYEKSKGLTTITELDNAQRDAEISAAQKSAALANIDRYRAEIEAAAAMKSAITERQAMLTVRAPFSGFVTGRFVDPGAMVQSALTNNNAMPIVSIEASNPVRLSLPLPATDIAGVKVGDVVSIEFPTMSGPALSAPITRIAKSLDATSKTMEVQVDLPNKDNKIKPGMYAKAMIKRASSNSTLSLPHSAVLMRKDATYIMTVKDDIVEEIQVKKGMSGKDHFEVLNNNVTANSLIIVKGKSSVKNGQRVKAVFKN